MTNVISANSMLATSPTSHIDIRSVETLSLEMQILAVRDADQQMRHIADQIRFLGDVRDCYRANLTKIENFLAQDQNTSRHDGKRFFDANYAQMADLMSALKIYTYDLSSQRVTESAMSVPDDGSGHSYDQENSVYRIDTSSGTSSFADWQKLFAIIAHEKDPKKAHEFANQLNETNESGNLPFYDKKKQDSDKGGYPIISIFVDSVEKLADQVRDQLNGVENDIEQISSKLNQLVAQRKTALDTIAQVAQKKDSITNHVFNRS